MEKRQSLAQLEWALSLSSSELCQGWRETRFLKKWRWKPWTPCTTIGNELKFRRMQKIQLWSLGQILVFWETTLTWSLVDGRRKMQGLEPAWILTTSIWWKELLSFKSLNWSEFSLKPGRLSTNISSGTTGICGCPCTRDRSRYQSSRVWRPTGLDCSVW